MSKTAKRPVTSKDRPPQPHERVRKCDACGEWFPPDQIDQERDPVGRSVGWFCGGCISWP